MAVGAQDSVAGDYQREGVSCEGVCDGAGGGRSAELLCQLAIGRCAAELQLPAGCQDCRLEGCQSSQVEGDIRAEFDGLGVEIRANPFLNRFEECSIKLGGGKVF